MLEACFVAAHAPLKSHQVMKTCAFQIGIRLQTCNCQITGCADDDLSASGLELVVVVDVAGQVCLHRKGVHFDLRRKERQRQGFGFKVQSMRPRQAASSKKLTLRLLGCS